MFVRGASPIWFFNTLTGIPLDDTYYAYFLSNDLPFIPQIVTQDSGGLIPWPSPLEFQPSGGLPNNLYFSPDLVYRIEVRQGPSQTAPLIWLIENYIAGSGESIETDALTTAANVITNPQFSDISFASPFTYTQASPSTYTLAIAPGWSLVLTGAGTTILTQGTLPGSGDLQGNPPYYLEINNSGWTTAQLIQTFNNNGALFGGGAIAVSFSAEATTNPVNVTVTYNPSGPTNAQNIFNGQVTTGAFNIYAGAIDLNNSLNTDLGSAASVQIIFNIPGTGIISFSNIQITGQSVPLSSTFVSPTDVPLFQEQSYEQIVNNEFHVYRQSLLNEPKNSLLTGWNFGLNPWQFTTTVNTNVAANQYVADQTIVIQQVYVASASGNTISAGRAGLGDNYGFSVVAVSNTNQFGILQYIAPTTMRQYWNSTVSAMVQVALNTSHSTTVQIKMRLIYKSGLPGSTSQTVPVASWTAGGDPVFSAGFTAIIPPNDPVYTVTGAHTYFPFDGMVLPVSNNANMTLGIFVYTTGNMNQNATADSLIFYDISLVQNDFALPTQPMTADESLRRCQYYYETSYNVGIVPGTSGANPIGQRSAFASVIFNTVTANASKLYPQSFQFDFMQQKNIIPTMSFYSPHDGTQSGLYVGILENGSYPAAVGGSPNPNPNNIALATWTIVPSLNSCFMLCGATSTFLIETTTASAAAYGDEGVVLFHYVCDSRLG